MKLKELFLVVIVGVLGYLVWANYAESEEVDICSQQDGYKFCYIEEADQECWPLEKAKEVRDKLVNDGFHNVYSGRSVRNKYTGKVVDLHIFKGPEEKLIYLEVDQEKICHAAEAVKQGEAL